MRILYDNKIIDAVLSAINVNPNFPAANIQDTRLAKFFKASIDGTVRIIIDGLITATDIAILGHNLPEGTITRIEANNTDEWSTPAFSQSLTWRSNIIHGNFNSKTYPFWSVFIDDFGSGAEDFAKVGSLFLGTGITLPGMKPNQSIPYATTSRSSIGFSGQAYGDQGYRFREFKVNFNGMTNDQKSAIQTMFDMVENTKPVVLLIWESDLDFEPPMYCIIDEKDLGWKKISSNRYGRVWNLDLKLQEVF